jgi:hypothetical protein
MLDRTGYADGDIDFGSDDLAGLADLVVVGGIAGVDRSAGGADAGPELIGERIDQRVELLGRAERAAAGDDDLRAGKLGALGRSDLGADESSTALVAVALTASMCRCRPGSRLSRTRCRGS